MLPAVACQMNHTVLSVLNDMNVCSRVEQHLGWLLA